MLDVRGHILAMLDGREVRRRINLVVLDAGNARNVILRDDVAKRLFRFGGPRIAGLISIGVRFNCRRLRCCRRVGGIVALASGS